MNRIVVGVLCGRGDTPEAVQTINACRQGGHVGPILPLFGSKPTARIRGPYIHMPEAADNKRGRARSALIQKASKLYDLANLYVFLDDDTVPQPGYFEHLAALALPEEPVLMGGKLLNADGQRSWDVCSFQGKNPVVVPYEFWDHPTWAESLYLSGPQHIFNKSGLALAVKTGYPDLTYGEDTNFCYRFKEAGGRLVFIPQITAKLAHQHNPPNQVTWTV